MRVEEDSGAITVELGDLVRGVGQSERSGGSDLLTVSVPVGDGRVAEYFGCVDGVTGKPQGPDGTMTFPSGNEYHGDFDDGAPNGQGIYAQPDGSSLEGTWLKGSRKS